MRLCYGKKWINKSVADLARGSQRSCLVVADEPAEGDHIDREDGSRAARAHAR